MKAKNEWMFNDTPARKTDQLLGVRSEWKQLYKYLLTSLTTIALNNKTT